MGLASMLIQPSGNILGDQHGGLVGQEDGQKSGGHGENLGVSSPTRQKCRSMLRTELPEVVLGWCRRLQAVQNQGRRPSSVPGAGGPRHLIHDNAVAPSPSCAVAAARLLDHAR
jgi:hypothetical protein